MIDAVRVVRRLFASDSVLPPQFVGTLRRQAPHQTGEYRLLIAVLGNAVECFQKYVQARSTTERRLFKEAEQWIMGGSEEDDKRLDAEGLAFTFRYVCDALDIEPEYLRWGLRRWRDAQLATVHVVVQHQRQNEPDRRAVPRVD